MVCYSWTVAFRFDTDKFLEPFKKLASSGHAELALCRLSKMFWSKSYGINGLAEVLRGRIPLDMRLSTFASVTTHASPAVTMPRSISETS